MSDPLRVALVGAGRIGATTHLPAMVANPRIRVAALVDPEESRAQKVLAQFGLDARVAPSVTDVVDEIDAAIVASPNSTHRDVAVACLERGVHVLVEKPLAMTLPEAEDIVETAEKHGVVALVGYDTRFMPVVDYVKELLDDGFFGQVHRFAYQLGFPGGWAPYSGYGMNNTGGGVLVVNGTHFLDRMLYWFGYPDRIEYWDDSCGGVDATCVCRFEFDRDGHTTKGEARMSKTASLPEGIAIDTDRGVVIVSITSGGRVTFRPRDRKSMRMNLDPNAGRATSSPRAAQMNDFVDACVGIAPSKVPARFGLLTQRLTDELYACRRTHDQVL